MQTLEIQPIQHPLSATVRVPGSKSLTNRTLLIDDNVSVLASARDYGIRHLLAVAQPDSSMPQRDIRDFRALDSFRQLFQASKQ